MSNRFKKYLVTMLVIVVCLVLAFNTVSLSLEKRTTVIDSDITEGSIYSSDNTTICEPVDGSLRGTVYYPEMYGRIIGYNTRINGRSGLRSQYVDQLYAENRNKIGNSLYLTINNDVQSYAYNLISKIGRDASCTVIENKTGRVIAMISCKRDVGVDYDVNDINTFMTTVENLPAGYYLNEATMSRVPGSIYKLISSIPIIEKGLDHIVYNDANGIYKINNGITISNNNRNAYGNVTNKEALVYSDNCYFCYMYDTKLSGASLAAINKKCLIGTPIDTDFGELTSNYNSTGSNFDVLQSSFGQGETLITPVHMAAIIAAVSNDGKMMKPYIIDNVLTPSGKIVLKTEPEVLSQITDQETCKVLRTYLQATADHYGYKNVYMKTGTAQADNSHSVYYDYSFCSNRDYTVLISAVDDYNNRYGMKYNQSSYDILTYTTLILSKDIEAAEADEYTEEDGLVQRLKDFLKDSVEEDNDNESDSFISRVFNTEKKQKDDSVDTKGIIPKICKFITGHIND